jgi:hypothetical protein
MRLGCCPAQLRGASPRKRRTSPNRRGSGRACGANVLTVLIWLNGPHGVGKTQVAFELHRRLPGSVVCGPEHLVNGLRRMLPENKLRTDLRGVPLWRAAPQALAPGDHAGPGRAASPGRL